MKHTLPVGGGELYAKLDVDPHVEWRQITQKYNARLHNYKEYGRLKLFHVSHNFDYNIVNSFREFFNSSKRSYKDYNIGARFKSKWKVLFK